MNTVMDVAAPSRMALRELLRPFERKNVSKAWGLFLFDFVAFIVASIGAVIAPLSVKIVCSAAISLMIARLFVIGHDACHGSYVSSRRQNRLIGKLAFLPSLTPFRRWEVGHNMTHHAFSNLAGKEHVWVPLSPEAYAQSSHGRKLWYRCTRSLYGAGLYYCFGVWWTELMVFNKCWKPGADRDTLLVSGFAVFWLSAISVLAVVTGENVWIALVAAFVVPFCAWNCFMGMVIYVHHTHPDVRWYDDRVAWAAAHSYITATVHVRFPSWFGAALHHIMEHPAHHLNPNIPLYHLRAAQRELEDQAAGIFIVQQFGLAWYRQCLSICKLYDYEHGRWVGFPPAADDILEFQREYSDKKTRRAEIERKQ